MAASLVRRNQAPGIWNRDDILDALAAVDAANWSLAQHIRTPEMVLYRQGFETAMASVAAAFGLAYRPPSRDNLHPPNEPDTRRKGEISY
jgi:hypothetical protein